MEKGNGETHFSTFSTDGMTSSEKLDLLLAAVGAQSDILEELVAQQEQLAEAIANLSTPGLDYDIFEEN